MNIEELKAFADEADRRGDTEAANAAFDKILEMQKAPQQTGFQKFLESAKSELVSGPIKESLEPTFSGIGRGLAVAGGLFGDTANNLANLVRAGFGYGAGAIGRIDLMPDPVPAAQAPLTYENTVNRLKALGVIKDYSGSASGRISERIMQDVAAGGAMGGAPGAAYGFATGTGAALAREAVPNSPTAEVVGSIAGALAPSGVRALKDALSPTRAIAKTSQVEELAKTPYGKRGQTISDQNQIDLKISQKYGSQKAASLEGEAAAMKPVEATKDELARKAQFGNRLEGVLRRINPEKISGKESARLAYNAYESENKAVLSGLRSNWKNAMEKIEGLTRGKRVVSIEPALMKLKSEIDDIASLKTRGQADTEALKILQNEYDDLINSGGQLSVREVQSKLASHTAEASGTGKFYKDVSDAAERRVHQVMKNAIDDSLDFFAQSPGEKYAKAGQLMKQARSDYRLQEEYLDELSYRLLGEKVIGKKETLTPDAIRKQLLSANSDERKYLIPLVEKHSPEAVQGFKEDYIRSILEKSKPSESVVGPGGSIDFKKMANAWKLDKEFFSTFQNRTERRELVRVREALRRLAEEPAPKHAQSTVSSMTEIAGIAGSLHPVFVFRALARRATPNVLSRLLMTREGRMAIEVAAGMKKLPDHEAYLLSEKIRKMMEQNPGAVASAVSGNEQ